MEGYELRRAAGYYWLIDTQQPGVPYKKPWMLNETGAEIFQLLDAYRDSEKVINELSKRYHIAESNVKEDVKQFVEELQNQGVKV